MFSNPGGKIKGLAAFLCALGIFASIIIGATMIGESIATSIYDSGNYTKLIWGVVIIVLGSIVSWCSSILVYGFGQLVENSDKIVEFNESDSHKYTPPPIVNNPKKHSQEKWECKKCGTMVTSDYDYCPYCEMLKDDDTEQIQRKKNFRQKLSDLVFEPVDEEKGI